MSYIKIPCQYIVSYFTMHGSQFIIPFNWWISSGQSSPFLWKILAVYSFINFLKMYANLKFRKEINNLYINMFIACSTFTTSKISVKVYNAVSVQFKCLNESNNIVAMVSIGATKVRLHLIYICIFGMYYLEWNIEVWLRTDTYIVLLISYPKLFAQRATIGS